MFLLNHPAGGGERQQMVADVMDDGPVLLLRGDLILEILILVPPRNIQHQLFLPVHAQLPEAVIIGDDDQHQHADDDGVDSFAQRKIGRECPRRGEEILFHIQNRRRQQGQHQQLMPL